MGNLQQTQTIKKALDLEVYIASTSQTVSSLLSEQFRKAPIPPTRNVIQRTYPTIEPKIKFNWKIACIPAIVIFVLMFMFWWLTLLLLPALVWIPIYYFAIHRKKRKEEIEQIRNSVEYKNQCFAADKEFDKMQVEADMLYQKQLAEYEAEILPKYQQELEQWTRLHNEKIEKAENDLGAAKSALNNLYETTKIVPIQYRKIEALQYIYNLMSTSDYDVKYAIDDYNRNEQRKIDEAKLYEQQQANQLADEQNMLLQEQNVISNKARRDANVASVVGAVQRHNTNKYLKNRKKR